MYYIDDVQLKDSEIWKNVVNRDHYQLSLLIIIHVFINLDRRIFFVESVCIDIVSRK